MPEIDDISPGSRARPLPWWRHHSSSRRAVLFFVAGKRNLDRSANRAVNKYMCARRRTARPQLCDALTWGCRRDPEDERNRVTSERDVTTTWRVADQLKSEIHYVWGAETGSDLRAEEGQTANICPRVELVPSVRCVAWWSLGDDKRRRYIVVVVTATAAAETGVVRTTTVRWRLPRHLASPASTANFVCDGDCSTTEL